MDLVAVWQHRVFIRTPKNRILRFDFNVTVITVMNGERELKYL